MCRSVASCGCGKCIVAPSRVSRIYSALFHTCFLLYHELTPPTHPYFNSNPQLSELPAFLVADGGLCSGIMIAHCTAASLVSENKVLVHPASCDSLSTSGAKEDHVSMGGFAARKALQIVTNVENVLAIELLCACQAIEFFRPLKTTPALEVVHAIVRRHVKPWDTDRHMSPDIEACAKLIRSGELARAVAPFLAQSPQASKRKDSVSAAMGSDEKRARKL